jgi:hypothetical protein
MRTTKTEQAQCAKPLLSAEQIIKDFINSDDLDNIEEKLHDLFMAYFFSKHEIELEERIEVGDTYMEFRQLVKKCKQYQLQKIEMEVSHG